MLEAAIAIGSALLPTLVEEIAAGLAEGLDEKAATDRALERMRAREIPPAVSGEIADRFRAARAEGAPAPAVPAPLVAVHRRVVERLLTAPSLSHEERDALRALVGSSAG